MRGNVFNYDKENDVLYISFYNPPLEADFSHKRGDFLFRSKDSKPIGVTILNYTRYKVIIEILLGNVAIVLDGGRTE